MSCDQCEPRSCGLLGGRRTRCCQRSARRIVGGISRATQPSQPQGVCLRDAERRRYGSGAGSVGTAFRHADRRAPSGHRSGSRAALGRQRRCHHRPGAAVDAWHAAGRRTPGAVSHSGPCRARRCIAYRSRAEEYRHRRERYLCPLRRARISRLSFSFENRSFRDRRRGRRRSSPAGSRCGEPRVSRAAGQAGACEPARVWCRTADRRHFRRQ